MKSIARINIGRLLRGMDNSEYDFESNGLKAGDAVPSGKARADACLSAR
jgi:hypothetical protein